MDLRAQRENFGILGWFTVGKRIKTASSGARSAPEKNSTFKAYYSAKTLIFLLSQTHENKGPHRIRGNLVKLIRDPMQIQNLEKKVLIRDPTEGSLTLFGRKLKTVPYLVRFHCFWSTLPLITDFSDVFDTPFFNKKSEKYSFFRNNWIF